MGIEEKSISKPACMLSRDNRRAMESLVEPPNLAGMVLSPLIMGVHVLERDALPPLHYAVETGLHSVARAGSVVVEFARRLVSTA